MMRCCLRYGGANLRVHPGGQTLLDLVIDFDTGIWRTRFCLVGCLLESDK